MKREPTSNRLLLALLSVALLWQTSCQKAPPLNGNEETDAAWRLIPGVRPAGPFNAAFTQFGPGWNGGDQCISIPLSSAKTLWLFGDSFIGTVDPDRTRPAASNTFVRNSAILQEASSMQTIVDSIGGVPSDWIKPPEPSYWYWPQDGYVEDGSLFLMCLTMQSSSSGGAFGFEFVRNDLVKVDLNSLEQTDRFPFPSAGKQYGAEVLEHDGYRYIYGVEDRAAGKRMVLARLPMSHPTGTVPPAYWDGTGWSANASDALPMLDDLSTIYSVFPNPSGGGFLMIHQEDFLSDRIFGRRSLAPEGPFEGKVELFRTPQDGGAVWTYNAVAHPQIRNAQGDVLVGYSSNTLNVADLFNNADTYRPWFAWVPMP